MNRHMVVVCLGVLLTWGGTSWAQSGSGEAAQGPPNGKSGKATQQPKAQPPPLFPKHRRGIYRNGQQLDVIDATPQSPPLPIDDPGVPDKGEYEVNLGTAGDFSHGARTLHVLAVDGNYGLVLRGAGHDLPTQLKIEMPVTASRDGDVPYAVGIGDVIAGLKFNFYNDENRGLRLAVYPQLEFSTAG